jgi:hypothetical protein
MGQTWEQPFESQLPEGLHTFIFQRKGHGQSLDTLETLAIPFEIVFKVEAEDVREERKQIVQRAESAIWTTLNEASLGVIRNIGALKSGPLRGTTRDLFPWLSGDGSIAITGPSDFGSDLLKDLFNLDEPLVGQNVEEQNIPAASVRIIPLLVNLSLGLELSGNRRDRELLVALFRITSVTFIEGSVWGWIKGNVEVLTLAATLLSGGAAVGYQPIADQIHHTTAINEAVQQPNRLSPMVRYRNFQINNSAIREAGARAFNFEEPKISDDEKRYRTALVQVALNADLKTNLVVDGQAGPDTHTALAAFGKRHNVPADVRVLLTQRELYLILEPEK